MRFLNKKKKKEGIQGAGDSLSSGATSIYHHLQARWAKWIAKRTASFSRGKWTLLLIFFVLLTGGYSTYLLVGSFHAKAGKVFTITSIRRPGHLTETGEAKVEPFTLSKSEYNRIHNFKLYMDSLARSPSGKMVYDSIMHSRPGLMDSVRYIDKYYNQLKN